MSVSGPQKQRLAFVTWPPVTNRTAVQLVQTSTTHARTHACKYSARRGARITGFFAHWTWTQRNRYIAFSLHDRLYVQKLPRVVYLDVSSE